MVVGINVPAGSGEIVGGGELAAVFSYRWTNPIPGCS
jgi:hypothetical protein